MNVKELKEFLKDIDDDVEVLCMQEKFDDHDHMYYHGMFSMKDDNIYFNEQERKIIIGA